MGVMSRRVLPACGSLCCICPSLRARSRQPVKRYKKLIADTFPRSQDGQPNERMIGKLCDYTSKNPMRIPKDGQPNERMIGKLCDYTSKNPMRIPKITDNLEQRFYKEMRSEHFHLAKVVPCIYSKLLSSCKEQMPMFASSMLTIIRVLLEQTRHDDLCILGCHALVDFLNCQADCTYMFNLEGLIPKLCQLCQPIGGDKALLLRSAGLQALASMVRFTGECSHISMEFDEIVSVTLENYEVLFGPEIGMQLPLSHNHYKVELATTVDISKSPTYWSRVCLHNMANLAKEMTTMRRVLEPLFSKFDEENYWNRGIAHSVLSYMQDLMEHSGKANDLLLYMVKHLDHRNVAKQIDRQVNIINNITQIARHAQLQTSVAIVTAISALMRHLRKCLQCSIEASNNGEEISKWNSILHSTLELCLVELINKVGDIGPILDMISVVLENLPSTPIIARSTVSSVFRTAQIAASIPNSSYKNEAFPEALFHQLVLAMSHPDNETRVGSHRIFSGVLAPSVACPWFIPPISASLGGYGKRKTLFVALSGFSSSDTILEEPETGNCSLKNESQDQNLKSFHESKGMGVEGTLHEHEDLKWCSAPAPTELHRMEIFPSLSEQLLSMRLSNHHVGILLSSIWVQASSQENSPASYEAMAHTYSLILLLSRTKASSHVAFVRSFQLAFSLRIISRDHENCLQPSRRRSLYTLATSMLVLSAKVGDLPDLVFFIKSRITGKMIDPHLLLVEDIRLQAVRFKSLGRKIIFGSNEDEIDALKFLKAIKNGDDELRDAVSSHLLKKYENLSKQKLVNIKQQLLEEFSPDDVFPLAAPLIMDTPISYSPLVRKENDFDELVTPAFMEDEDSLIETCKNQSDHKISESKNSMDILNVNQLIESVLETARQVTTLPVPATPVPYEEMKIQCEALVMGKQKKMSVLLSFKSQSEGSESGLSEENENQPSGKIKQAYHHSEEEQEPFEECTKSFISQSSESEQSFWLPPSSPYDKFLKAAGC